MMPEKQYRLDKLLRKLAGSPVPSRSDQERAESQLMEFISGDPTVRRSRVRRLLIAWTAVALIAALTLIVLFQPGSTSPAAAAMSEIADLAEQVEPLEATDQSFVYTRSETQTLVLIPKEGLGDTRYAEENLVYYENTIRESWIGNDETVQVSVTVLQPSFFNDMDEDVYYAAGLDAQDRVGETIISTVSQPDDRIWPTDPVEFDAAIRDDMITDRGLPEPVEYLLVALDIIRESHASPELRAETLRLIGDLDGLESESIDPDGIATFSVDYEEQAIMKTLTFSVDTSGILRFEEVVRIDEDTTFGIPAGSVESSSTWDQPRTTTNLNIKG